MVDKRIRVMKKLLGDYEWIPPYTSAPQLVKLCGKCYQIYWTDPMYGNTLHCKTINETQTKARAMQNGG